MEDVIDNARNDDTFWDLLQNQSQAQSGPNDGGCLIFAKALVLAFPGAELVRLCSDCNGGQTEHYGVQYEGTIFDFDGAIYSPAQWIDRFTISESIKDRKLFFEKGYDPYSSIPDDPVITKMIASLFMNFIAEAHKRATCSMGASC